MDPRDHHFFFAKKMLTTHTFQSPDQMFNELSGPKREAFLMYLWQEAGKGMSAPLPHLDVVTPPGGTLPEVVKLEVIGAIKANGLEVVVIRMPPTKMPNEAMFVALVRGPQGKSVFFYERCRDKAMTGISDTDAVLAEMRDNQMRVNHGFYTGLGLNDFKTNLGAALGISLDGLETSLPAITMDAFVAGARQPQIAGQSPMGGRQPVIVNPGGRQPQIVNPGSFQPQTPLAPGTRAAIGDAFEKLLLVRAALPLVLRVVGPIFGSMSAWSTIRGVETLLNFSIAVCLLIWLHQVYMIYQGRTIVTPGLVIFGWIIPSGNWSIPEALSGALQTACGKDGKLAYWWWGFYLLETISTVLYSMQMSAYENGSDMPHLPSIIMDVLFSPLSFFIPLAAYGLLWQIVKRVNSRT